MALLQGEELCVVEVRDEPPSRGRHQCEPVLDLVDVTGAEWEVQGVALHADTLGGGREISHALLGEPVPVHRGEGLEQDPRVVVALTQ